MGTIWVKEFTGGLDARKMPETTPGGALIKAQDGHLNRGGEFEQRPAFVLAYTLPTGASKGLAKTSTSLYAFGHQSPPAMPPGVLYQQILHPNGITALTRVLSFDLFKNKIYVVGLFADGSIQHFYDGVRVDDWFDGRARAKVRVAGGTGSSTLTSLKVDGVEIISGTITWATSNSDTAAAIAADINAHTSTPDYTATSDDEVVNIIAATAGASANGRLVTSTVADGFVLAADVPLGLSGGADPSSGAFQPGDFVKTIGRKMYSVSGPNLHASGISLPAGWTSDNLGALFVDMSAEAAGAEILKAVARYQTFAAVFAETVILVYFIDPDPALNKLSQTLSNTGTVSGKSVVGFGDNDLFYLSTSGVRSLRARDASNAAATTDIGVPVDTLLVNKMKMLTTDELNRVTALIEPSTGRFWLVFADEIFIFSYFPGSKVSAWSTYLPTYVDEAGETQSFVIDDVVVFQNRVYLRSVDKIFAFGGTTENTVYDATEPELWLPYLDANFPTKKKTFEGVDVACEGTWKVFVSLDPTEIEVSDHVATVHRTTFNIDKIPAEGESTHISLRFTGQGSGFKKIGATVIHYVGELDED